jgi:cell division protein FtsW
MKYILGIGTGALLILGSFVFFTPYLQERVKTFINPSIDPRGSSYQIQQSLIALGSGGIFGRGFGQSIQKFSYLPEPQGDSIFAVLGEELGFVGGAIMVILFLLFFARGIKITGASHDVFGRFLGAGLIFLIIFQVVINISAIIGLMPLTGIPLSFVSYGGTAMMITLAEVGIIFNIAKNKNLKNKLMIKIII